VVGAALYRPKGYSPVELMSAFGMLSAATKSWIPLYWESRPHIAMTSARSIQVDPLALVSSQTFFGAGFAMTCQLLPVSSFSEQALVFIEQMVSAVLHVGESSSLAQ